MQNLVIKRDGSSEPFDIIKTKKVIEWACNGLDVNPLLLEAHVDITFKNNTKTSDIQNNLIQHASSLCDIDNPEWRYVAGRLLMMTRWKLFRTKLYEVILTFVSENKYNIRVLNTFTQAEINYLEKHIKPELDLTYDIAGAKALLRRYLLTDESVQQMLMASSIMLSEGSIDKCITVYNKIAYKKLSLATPILSHLRKPTGNLSSCFIIKMEDDLDHIYDTLKNAARISKVGGGVGINISSIRAKGSNIQGVKNSAKGVLPWCKLINDTAIACDQLGKRNGAITVALDIHHYDILDFISCQLENGDLRTKSFDIFPQVILYDEFMRRVEDNQDWYVFDPHEVYQKFNFKLEDLYGEVYSSAYNHLIKNIDKIELYSVFKAKELFKEILKTTVETGLPFLVFKDTINRVNPNSHCGVIYSVNLCVESFSNFSANEAHTCDLISLNLANIEDHELEDCVYTSIEILDTTLDISKEPLEESTIHHNKYRVLGLGSMGLHDWLVKRKETYETAYAKGLIKNLFDDIEYYAVKKSIELAMDKGPYPAFEGSKWESGEMIEHFAKYSDNPNRWLLLQDKINQYGIRNSQLTAIAPNTSTSLIQGCTASVLPTFNAFFYDSNSKGNVPICPPYIKDNLLLYKEYKRFDMFKMVDIISEIQKFTDTGISFESCFDLNNPKITAKYLYDFVLYAWKKEIKTLYYTRFIQVNNTNMKDKRECAVCAN